MSIRILGVHFDPELFLNQHIEIVQKKVEKKLNMLTRLAFCKYYDFKPYVIHKLFETVIRPQLEYALCTTSTASRFKELEKIQKRALRIALRAKTQTKTKLLMEIINGKTIQEKVEEQQVKMWHQYSRAPDYLLPNLTFKKWQKYIETNDKNSRNKFGNLELNGCDFNVIRNSPLSRSYLLIKSLYPTYRNLFCKKESSVLKPPPIYHERFPSNININPNNTNNINNNYYDFYTDGSCDPNPGPGGAAYFSPNFIINQKIHVVDHDTTINYCELYAIKLVLSSICRYLVFCNNNNMDIQIDRQTSIYIYIYISI